MCCVGASIVTCKLGLAIGLGFFQICVRIFILYVYSVSNRHIQYFENCIAKPCPVGHLPFNCSEVIITS